MKIKSLFLISLAYLLVTMLPVQAQQLNPLEGAWQLATFDEVGVATYKDIIKVYTPSGLLKGVGNLQTENEGYMWLDGTYEITGNGAKGSYIEHCKWHKNPESVGKDANYYYEINSNVLTITSAVNPDIKETWVRVAKMQRQEQKPLPSWTEPKIVEAYKRDKAKFVNKPFGLVGLWKKGELVLRLGGGPVFLKSKKEFEDRKAFINLYSSRGRYVLMCEDGVIFQLKDIPKVIEVLDLTKDDEDSDEDVEVEENESPLVRKLDNCICEQYSVLSPTELGKDEYIGRESFYPLCEDVYQTLLTNGSGDLMTGEYYWRANTNNYYYAPIPNFQQEPKKEDNDE